MPTLTYKGYEGYYNEFNKESDMFYGRVRNIKDVLTFQGETKKEIRQAFRDSVDCYLDFCKEEGITTNEPSNSEVI